MVEVVHGPLKGVVGRLIRKGAHARLVLSVDLIGQAVSVEVDAADVRRLLTAGHVETASDEDWSTRSARPRRSSWPRWPA